VNEHDYEPIPGLPAALPPGESIVWQGAPCWRNLAWRALRVRQFAAYFSILTLWAVTSEVSGGAGAAGVALSALRLTGLAVLALCLLSLFGWLVARTTLYTVTTRRVVMRIGIALPITLQIPFRLIEAADLRAWPDGSGDIALRLGGGERIAYLLLWPHARPWKIARPVPSLRSIADAATAARLLGRALAASSAQPAKSLTVGVPVEAASGAHVPAAA
jgi:hypothetical protein